MPEWMLEKEYTPEYQAWKAKPGPETSSPLLKKLDPVINTSIHLYGLGSSGPLVRGRAKRIVVDALPRYDPEAAKLNSYMYSHLQGLRRVVQQQSNPLHTPERVLLDQQQLYESEGRLKDDLGREASDLELADETGLSLKRINHIRTFRPGVAEGQLKSKQPDSEEGGVEPAVLIPGRDVMDPWTEFVYHSLQPIDRVVMERTLGLHGKRPLGNKEIAQILRVTPSAVSQRKTKIQTMLNKRATLGVTE